jgi:hypothetical protein
VTRAASAAEPHALVVKTADWTLGLLLVANSSARWHTIAVPQRGSVVGLYLRKSVSVGPLRFNFSTSGIGVSAGIPGFRVGTGPRGHYVHMGAGGVYYRATLPQRSGRGSSRLPNAPPELRPHADTPIGSVGIGPMREIDSGSAIQMTDESAADLLAELTEKNSSGRLTPLVGLLGALVLAAAVALQPSVAAIVLIAVAAVLAFVACRWRDELRKTTVIGYELDEMASQEYEALVSAVRGLAAAQHIWHVAGEADVYDQKRNAGASSVIQRAHTRVGQGLPRFIRSNIDVPWLQAGRQQLYFFPDRMLVFESERIGAIPYTDLRISRGVTRFIENEAPPGDAHAVGQTWRYVNKSGGPDRRFNDNRQLPIMQYEALHLTSASGLNELLHVSRVGAGQALCAEIEVRRTRASRSLVPPAVPRARSLEEINASPPRNPRRFR